jgi:putative colanic acid biosysnthesis UDP-glucose lipid carrier transferase
MKKKTYKIALRGFYLLLDSLCIVGSLLLAYLIYHALDLGQGVVYNRQEITAFAGFLVLGGWGVMFLFRAYHRNSGILNVLEIRGVILGLLTLFAVINVLFFALRYAPSRYVIVMAFTFMLLLLPLVRSVVYSHLVRRQSDVLFRRILIYGAGELGQRLFKEITNSPRRQVKVCGFIDDDPAKQELTCYPNGFEVGHVCRMLGRGGDLPDLVRLHRIDEVQIAISGIGSARLREIVAMCRELGVGVAFVPGLHNIFAHRISVEHIGNLPLVREKDLSVVYRYDRFKRVFDLFCVAVLGVVLGPLMVVIALMIRRGSPGPVFFKQNRVGKDGKLFKIYKFRSMYVDAPAYAINPDSSDDPRITRVGRFLRKTSLDELPQLINVLRGEMSLVGPRPEMPFIVEQYNDLHRERLMALPGITGLWQLSGDRRKAIHENMDYDLYYVYNRSFFLDVAVLIQTLLFAFKGI